MKNPNDFIIEIGAAFHDKFLTEGGLELFGDKRWLAKQLANITGKVISKPLNVEVDIEEGYEVVIDAGVLIEQIYHLTNGVQENIFLANKAKGWYKVDPNLVIIYRENKISEWKGFRQNAVFEKIEINNSESQSGLIFTEIPKVKKYHTNRVKLVYGNKNLDVLPGEVVIVDPQYGLPFMLGTKSYLWYRNQDCLASLN
jgi:hypothetical protein